MNETGEVKLINVDAQIKKKVKELKRKKVWGFACDYCKELKLSESEIKEMRRNYIFNKKPCNECSMGHKLSYLI